MKKLIAFIVSLLVFAAVQAQNTAHRKKLCLSVEIAEAEDKEFCIVDTMKLCSESLYL